jgi:hypothetical protein
MMAIKDWRADADTLERQCGTSLFWCEPLFKNLIRQAGISVDDFNEL